jgi:Na+-transporting NADH:ubiquinone oxidoreductase subunit D
MSEVKEKEVIKVKKSEALLSKRRRNILIDPLDDNNPVTIQVLGICSALAVTIKLEPTIVMSLSVVFVMIFSSLLTSLVRDYIPTRVRIIVQLAIIARLKITLILMFTLGVLFLKLLQLEINSKTISKS